MADCTHLNFSASVGVARLEDRGGFMAEIKVHCADCGIPFQFLGLEPGLDLHGARVSLDCLEANIAIAPQGTWPSHVQRMVNGRGKFDA
jgi:hypothetical protein